MKNNVYINLFQFIRRLYILTINLLPFVSVAEHFLGKVTLKAVTDFSLLSKLRVSVPHIYIYTLRLCCPRPMTLENNRFKFVWGKFAAWPVFTPTVFLP